jgi:hypothetical protein
VLASVPAGSERAGEAWSTIVPKIERVPSRLLKSSSRRVC